jgi:hypothetical protein
MYSQLIPEKESEYDVIVAGGGPAGLAAALASANSGAKTLILEAEGFFGGVASTGLWMPVNRILTDGYKGEPRGGVLKLISEKLTGYGNLAYVEGKENFINDKGTLVTDDSLKGKEGWQTFSDRGLNIQPEYLEMAVFELLEEHGCHYRLYSPVTGVIKDGNRLKGVVTTAKDGAQEFRAKIVIDATGDGDVAAQAGVDMVKGSEEEGRFMPITLCFALSNVRVGAVLDFVHRHKESFVEIIRQAAAEGYYTSKWYSFEETPIPDVVSVNNGGFIELENLDGTKSRDLTIARRTGIQVAIDFVRIARSKKLSGLEECYLIRTGSGLGVRETRRIKGEYILTVEDCRTGNQFEDNVARKYGPIDAVYFLDKMSDSGVGYPYRSLLPKRIDNLLVAGRCGSATHLGHAAGKDMGNMMALGQAAGVAAALCVSENVTPRELKVSRVQSRLKEMGALI